jgi:hypothetical protein
MGWGKEEKVRNIYLETHWNAATWKTEEAAI